ncbi:DNA methylase [Mycobacterium phage LittleE]|uniref:DNA methylase n=1 Tax=Mycobacterium phage LittleE TaxID=2922212 RepID=G1D436_9CAUD|nr:DNA methyltransferase [Mycobacterium phage LittleE]AEK09531.1 DNA methylase [Mycobacterium phage LittleE]
MNKVDIRLGDCRGVLASFPDASVDAILTDPPYGLEFMGKDWDAPWKESDVNADAGFHGGGISATRKLPSFTGTTNPKCLRCKGTRRGRRDGTAKVAVCLCRDGGQFPNVRAVEMRAFQQWSQEWAAECLRVLKPGGYLLAFGGSRTWHRLAAAIEDAGFELRDSIAWLYGSGFPKSLDVSKAIDKAAGAERGASTAPATEAAWQWQGWGTALKPSFEPIVVARKPLVGTVAANVLEHGTGALNIDACRIETTDDLNGGAYAKTGNRTVSGSLSPTGMNVPGKTVGKEFEQPSGRWPTNVVLDEAQAAELGEPQRFFPVFKYQAKAPTKERPSYVNEDGNKVAHQHRQATRPHAVAGQAGHPAGGRSAGPLRGQRNHGGGVSSRGFRLYRH